jgi:predicted lipoprotein with Yx(FWY)xxD motif
VKRGLIAAVALVALALAASAAAGMTRPATVKLAKSSLGKILVDGSGRTLYMFTKDRRGKDRCVGISGCTGTWPVLSTRGKPVAGAGAKSSLLGTITIAHGVKQVTYAGHPLYTYSGDFGPHQTDYVGTPEFGGTWYAVNAAGRTVK